MNAVFTIGQAFSAFLAFCAAIACIALAISWIAKGIAQVRKPERDLKERLAELERRTAKHDEFLDKDKERLAAIEEGNKVTQRAILALLAHGIDGNDIDALKDAKDALQDYLIKR